jgi:Acyl-CoA dehydrogenase, C-terminal domain
MDFDASDGQQARLEGVNRLVQEAGGMDADPAALDSLLFASDVAASALVLDRFLIAEELARLGTGGAFGTRVLVDDLLPEPVPTGAVALAEAGRRGPVRFADTASVLIVLDGPTARLFTRGQSDISSANTIFGYHYGKVSPSGYGVVLPDGLGDAVRRRWRLALVAEIAGNAHSAIHHTSQHLTSRTQFGRPLSSFQALRHRLAESAVSAEATRWLGRDAAFHDDTHRTVRAAWYASHTAAQLVPELVQMCGARSFTMAFGLHTFTMRMNCLRLELGGIDRIGAELTGASADSAEATLAASR